jgi:hypothetical protein
VQPKKGTSMSQVISQTVFKPNPGADMSKLMALVAESAAIWRKHGAEVAVWTVSSGEIGNMIFSARYESYEAYGKCTDAVVADPAYQAWTAKGVASGLSTWVRSGLARQIAI